MALCVFVPVRSGTIIVKEFCDQVTGYYAWIPVILIELPTLSLTPPS